MKITPIILAGLALLVAIPIAAAEKRSGKVILHSTDFRIEDMFLTYTLDHPSLEDKVRDIWEREIDARAKESLGLEVIDMPKLSDAEEAKLDEAEDFAVLVVSQARRALNPEVKGLDFAHKRQDFDYTVGDSFNFLRDKTGADFLMFYYARQYIPDSSRTVQSNSMRMSDLVYTYAALIDLDTGRIVWLETAKGDLDLVDAGDRQELVDGLFGDYPNSRYFETLAGGAK